MPPATKDKFDWARLKRLEISNPAQLVLYLPSKFEDFSTVTANLREWVNDSQKRVLRLTVTGYPAYTSGPPKVSIPVMGEDIQATLTAFGAQQDWNDLKPGYLFHVLGTVKEWNGLLYVNAAKRIPELWVGKVKPKYARKKGVLSEENHAIMLDHALGEHLEDAVAHVRSWFGESVASVPDSEPSKIRESLLQAHRPTSAEEGTRAIEHIELLAAREMLHRAKTLANSRTPVEGSALTLDLHLVKRMIDALPYGLTKDQLQAVREIVRDLKGPIPMNRLLSGDVGTGKSVTILLPLVAAAIHHPVAIVTYNVPLSNALAREAVSIAQSVGLDIPIRVITGDKKDILPERGLVIGTSAVINHAEKHGWEPAAVVVDEQHKAGKKQRKTLKTERTNYMEATATCIPQTGAFILAGGMDLSVLKERPFKRDVETRIYAPHQRQDLFAILQDTVKAGKQAAIIYPAIEGKDEKSAASKVFAKWQKHFGAKTALIHGRMSDAKKEVVLQSFREGKLSVMVTTMMIELGLTLPDLAAMVVVDPIRFSIVTLHQLRGRIARNGGSGKFCLYQREEAADLSRLDALVKHDDGFKIAEIDMLERGAGDLEDENAQHGKTGSILPGRVINIRQIMHIA